MKVAKQADNVVRKRVLIADLPRRRPNNFIETARDECSHVRPAAAGCHGNLTEGVWAEDGPASAPVVSRGRRQMRHRREGTQVSVGGD